jgi:zinc protease
MFDIRNVMVAVSGDFKRADMLAKLEKLFARWPIQGEAAPPVPKPLHAPAPGLYIVEKDVNQGRVSMLLPGLMRTDPDYFPAVLMNDILGGGGFTSRITNRVRSDEGLAYHASSGISGGVWFPGMLTAVFQSKLRTCSYAAQVVLEEMKGMLAFGTDPAKAAAEKDELVTAQKSFVETLPRRFATKAQIVGVLLEEEYTGRYRTDPEYFAKFRARIEAVTPADVQRAARRLLKPESVAILVVGNRKGLLEPDPAHPVAFASLTGGKLTDLPLRDPFTMKPLAPAATR